MPTICSNCGQKNPSRRSTCNKCQAALDPQPANKTSAGAKVARKTKIDNDTPPPPPSARPRRENTKVDEQPQEVRRLDKRQPQDASQPTAEFKTENVVRKTVLGSDPGPPRGDTVLDPSSCKSCGAELRAGAKFCANCGTPTTPGMGSSARPDGTIGVVQEARTIGFLLSFSQEHSGTHYPVVEGRNTIGREREHDISLFYDGRVSSTQAEILCRPGTKQCVIIDKDSTHGTVVNGEDLGIGGRANLNSGDTLRVGSTNFVFFLIDFEKAEELWPDVWAH